MLQDSSIIIRVQNFLRTIHPFCFLSDTHLQSLSKNSNVGVYKSNREVFIKGAAPKLSFFVVKKGAVEIIENTEGTNILIDKCGEGDMFGIRPLLAETNYLYTALCTEDTILYEIPLVEFKALYMQYDEAVDYMIKRFAAGTSIRDNHETRSTHIDQLLPTAIPLQLSLNRKLITTPDTNSLSSAIKIMNDHGVSSIIISNEDMHPLGIITDRDIRRLVATGYDGSVAVTSVMSKPVMTIPPNMILQEVQLTMIESGLHHLCITEDGTTQTRGLGMVTEHDILYANASDPVVILKKIKSAKDTAALKICRDKIDALLPNFLNDNLNRRITLSLIDRLNRSLIQKVVELCLRKYNDGNIPLAENSFSFYNMGSAARGEQLLMTDQDNGILIADEYASSKDQYLNLAKSITDMLHNIGYEYCPANMMASNPDWCKTVSEMKSMTKNWILSPGPEEVLMTAIFFDFRHEFGNKELADDLKTHISDLLQDQDMYIRFLGKQAVANPPPLSFFRKFIIEKDGDYKDRFDIKLRGLSPLSDFARVLALDHCYLSSTNTYSRYEHLKTQDPANAILYEDAAEGYLDLLHFRLLFALKNKDSGRYINIDKLDKIHRIHIRRAFGPSRQLLDMIERKYRLSYL